MALRPPLSQGLLFRILFVRIITNAFRFPPFISVIPVYNIATALYSSGTATTNKRPQLAFP
jgi:hypothetical protein